MEFRFEKQYFKREGFVQFGGKSMEHTLHTQLCHLDMAI
jgi:hypothetical protein